jgi:hypothetical protein
MDNLKTTIKIQTAFFDFFNEVFGNAEDYINFRLSEDYHRLRNSFSLTDQKAILEETKKILSDKFDEIGVFELLQLT